MNLIRNSDKLGALITGIAKNVKSLKADIHLAACSAALHVAEHGDVSLVNRLCEATKDAVHNNAVNHWFAEQCKLVKWDTKAKEFVLNKTLRKAILLEDGKADPAAIEIITAELTAAPTYYELRPAPAYKPVNVIALLKSALRKAEGLSDEEKADPRNNLEGLDDLRKLVAKLAPEALLKAA